jgi:ABC-2 type transport system permease protein
MTWVLVRKLLRDVRLALLIVVLLLAAFECLWAKITQRITEEVLPKVTGFMPLSMLGDLIFEGPGKLMQTLLGGESINFTRALDVLSIGYIHPTIQTILCIWAVGRAAGAIAGEIDRGTMELLLAQPLARYRVILAHLCVDLCVIPLLCLGMWAGNWIGVSLFGRIELGQSSSGNLLRIDPRVFTPALSNVAALLFAISGYTMWLSARGRFRNRVLGAAILVTLLQFLVNVIGQMWDAVGSLRPLTVFYYYQPQQIILDGNWTVPVHLPWQEAGTTLAVNGLAVLLGVGTVGYAAAWWTFCRRDLPAPL